MKKLLLAIMTMCVVGCTSKTPHGRCIGILQDKDPALEYETNVINIVVGFIFIETFIVPAIVLFDGLQCPIGKKVTNETPN